MASARSQVQISITAQLAQGFQSAFQTADGRMASLARTAGDLSGKIGDVQAYRKQQNALRESGTEYMAARKKASELRAEVEKLGRDNGYAQKVKSAADAQKQLNAAWTDAKSKATALAYAIKQAEKPTAEQRAALAAAKEAAKQAGAAYKEAARATDALKREQNQAAGALQKAQRELKAADQAAAKAGQSYQQARTKLQEMAQALRNAGVNTGKLSSEYKRLQAEQAASNAKMHQAEQSLARQQKIMAAMSGMAQKAGMVAGGAIAGAATLAAPTKKALSYEEQLAYMTDTVGVGKGTAEKVSIQQQLSTAIEQSRQYSKGATREDVATALQTMIASGKYKYDDQKSQDEVSGSLKEISRAAFASGASAEDMAKTAVALKQFGLQDPTGQLDKILMAGKLGSFEMKEQSKYLPMQLALAKAAGYSGESGLTDLLALNQIAMTTAGSQDEAGNNVINLLQKFSSREFAKSMADNVKVEKGDAVTKADPDAKGKAKKGGQFDWSGYMIEQREKGVTAVDAFATILERQLAGNEQYTALQKRMASAKTDAEKRETLGAMSDIAAGSEVGKIIADRQALMAALASIYGKKDLEQMRQDLNSDKTKGEVERSSEYLGSQNFAKTKMLSGNIDRANEQTYSQVSGPMGAMLDKINSATQSFPGLTTAAYGAAAALGAVAAAGLGGSIMGGILKKGTGGAVGAAASGAATAATAATAAATGTGFAAKLAGAAKSPMLGKAGAVGAVAGAGITAYDTATNDKLTKEQKGEGYGGAVGGLAGGLAGAKLGGMAGAMAGPLGAGLGAVAGGIIGSIMGDKLGQLAGGWAMSDATPKPAQAQAITPALAARNLPQAPAMPPAFSRIAPQSDPAKPAFAAPAAPVKPQASASPAATAATDANTAASAASAAAASQDTAKSAQAIAAAVAVKPNVTITNSYAVSVNATVQGAVELGAQIEKSMRNAQRKADADARASWAGSPAY